MKSFIAVLTGTALAAGTAFASELSVEISRVDAQGVGKSVGRVTLRETAHGVVFQPALRNLPPGLHGFHVHENPSCNAGEKEGQKTAALAAGGHYDPHKTARHGEPWGDGHLGDLPALYVDQQGKAEYPVLAPRLKLKDVKGRALMVHADGDNHSDQPAHGGGGGARMACGVIK